MGLFRGRIDPATGRNTRDKGTLGDSKTWGIRPERQNGRIIRGGRAKAAREKKTGVREPRGWSW